MTLPPGSLLFFTIIFTSLLTVSFSGCTSSEESSNQISDGAGEIRLMTLNPGHFHAALVQKNELEGVSSRVHIYSPGGEDLALHMQRINGFNQRNEDPTEWESVIYEGHDYFKKMLEEQPGNVMIVAGNNRLKTDYILQAVDEGIHVLSDKPMAIDSGNWIRLRDAFRIAGERGVLLYDIMTERYEVTSRIQRILAQNRELFGELQTGTPDEPAVVKQSVHHLYKMVAGAPLRRPQWYFDTLQQGEGIVDVTTHLVDLSLWGTFPDEAISYESDVELIHARRWPTMLTEEQFGRITGASAFPDFLQEQLLADGRLPYYSNGEIGFTLREHHVNVSVEWAYEAPPGGNDTHYSLMRGTHSNLVIRQGADQNFRSTLFVEMAEGTDPVNLERALEASVEELSGEFPGLSYLKNEYGFELIIPDEYYLGHEAHFGKVAEAYFGYLKEGRLPHWEIPNMITKYYITTQARELAMRADSASDL
ncbi:MAG: oxidoreductase [Balneolaceae bacterium]|nr:MAG: oxidoreductase [Balneolaceae bacterium]